MNACTPSDVWTKERVCSLIDSRDVAVAKAICLIYSKQTASEQSSDSTNTENGVGFAKPDAEFLSSCARFYTSKGFLTAKQLAMCRNKVKKYWRQILDDLKAKGYEVSYKVTKVEK